MTSSAVASYPIVLKDSPTIWRGDVFDWTLQMGADAATVDLTGYGTAWAATLRRNVNSGTGLDFAVDATHLTDGYIVLSLTGAQTALLELDSVYGFDVEATGGTRSPITVWAGELVVAGDFTHG